MGSKKGIMQVGCLYIPSFPAWAFTRVEAPGGDLVVVAAGKVIAAGKAAVRRGIEPGVTAERAKTLFPEARIRLRDAHLEAAAWEEVLQALNGITPFMEDDGSPFAFFASDDGPAVRHLTNTLHAQTGVAPARSIARLAALRAATGNTLVISPKLVPKFLERFEVERLTELGFEEETTEMLQHFGYGTLGAVRRLSLRHLEVQFGDEGARLYDMLHPADEPRVPLYREPRTIRVAYEFDDACREPRELMPVLEHLVEQAARVLRPEYCQRLRLSLMGTSIAAPANCKGVYPGCSAVASARDGALPGRDGALFEGRGVPLRHPGTPLHHPGAPLRHPELDPRRHPGLDPGSKGAGYDPGSSVFACRILREPVGNARSILRAAEHLLGKILPAAAEVETISLELGALRHIRSTQVPLFRSRPSVFTAVRAVHRRFPGAVYRAVVQPDVLFSEDEMRFDPYPEKAPARRGRRRAG